ncbi:MAG TPA: MBL fold metallo-hydrolase [Thermoanaerobaculia bacterium]|jgi:L-ascorbate metabolism protein UlaG (beta-lactamase superfamily)|nr:MBL fold metallo-hydrolase [Thermoanaerobaculia bacterium]
MTKQVRSSRRRRILIALAFFFVIVVIALLYSTDWLASLGGHPEGARLERVHRSAQYKNGKFSNSTPSKLLTGSTREMVRRQFFGKEQREPLSAVPVVNATATEYATPPASGLRATWIGWSSVLVEIDGKRVLTDPVWSERCSPSTLVGPKRFHAPPIALDALPPIDVVVISHDHYDHLDMPVVRALSAKGTHFAVPLGIGVHLERWGVLPQQIVELDWNESADVQGLRVIATPSRHYSGRNPLYNNQTLWASWVVKGPAHTIYFSGDTGYFDGFKKIGAEHGPFDLTLLKIGAYDPSWEDIHMNPEQAVQAHQDLRGRVMLPVHWATFNLGIHAWREPPDRAVAAARKAGITLVMPKPGEAVEPSEPQAIEEWWQ